MPIYVSVKLQMQGQTKLILLYLCDNENKNKSHTKIYHKEVCYISKIWHMRIENNFQC